MYSIKTTFSALLLLMVIFTSCKKDKKEIEKIPDPPKTIWVSKISKSLYPFLFDNGSYWIYKDTISNVIDSISLTSISKYVVPLGAGGPGQGSPGDLEYFGISYYNHTANYAYSEQLLGYVIARGFYGGYTLLSNKNIGEKNENAEISDVLDSLTVEGNTYYNVVKMKITKDSYIDNNYNFYYVDNIGIIKKETTSNDSIINTSNLLRYNTVMYTYQ